MSIIHKRGDLFGVLEVAARPTLLAHSNNCQGVWGAGIAKEFQARFPEAYREYKLRCAEGVYPGDFSKTHIGNEVYVANLFTSRGYGKYKDSPDNILSATADAARQLFYTAAIDLGNAEIHMPLINAGYFGVDWRLTEAVLLREMVSIEASLDVTLKVTVWRVPPFSV